MRNVYLVTAFLVVLAISIVGFRGRRSTPAAGRGVPRHEPPGEVQAAGRSRSSSPTAAPTGRCPPASCRAGARRRRIPTTCARRFPLSRQGRPTARSPAAFPPQLAVDRKFMERGRERYTIYCAPCHGAAGRRQGHHQALRHGDARPRYHDDRIRQMPEGEIFNTITNGKNTT